MALHQSIERITLVAGDQDVGIARSRKIRCDLDIVCVRAAGAAAQDRSDDRYEIRNDLSVVVGSAAHGEHGPAAEFVLGWLAFFPGQKFGQGQRARINVHDIPSDFQFRRFAADTFNRA
jgi:hypothetical protein